MCLSLCAGQRVTTLKFLIHSILHHLPKELQRLREDELKAVSDSWLFHYFSSLYFFSFGPGEFTFLIRISAWKFVGAELYFPLAFLSLLTLYLPVQQASKT